MVIFWPVYRTSRVCANKNKVLKAFGILVLKIHSDQMEQIKPAREFVSENYGMKQQGASIAALWSLDGMIHHQCS